MESQQEQDKRIIELEKELAAKNRELEIEAALERVRTKTMAMHNSQDVGNTVAALFDELKKLEVSTTMRCGIFIVNETKYFEIWTAAAAQNGKVNLLIGRLDMMRHPLTRRAYRAWKDQKPFDTYELVGEEVKSYYDMLVSSSEYSFRYDSKSLPAKENSTAFFFPEGALFAFTPEPLSAEAIRIFRRFAGVFSLTYRRFLDLLKAEANAKEAVRQASLDRVRAEIASMRTTSDLERITPLIWKELTILNIAFIRCGVFIMDEKEEQIHIYLSTPEGKAIAVFQLPINGAGVMQGALDAWRNNQLFIEHWDAATFLAWTKSLVDHGAIKPEEKYSTEKPPENLYLHFLPFLQGMLYVGNTAQLSQDEIILVQSLANAFSTAYARYEDFNKLEAAKQQIEKTLSDLKAAQAQLIQSEKMASLGELTAGIAHEIQNPLNFVNNFSEVSVELLDEQKQVIKEGNKEEAISIADDIKGNLQKVVNHGKRADAIVKGMLQHSRVSTGEKQPIDLNVLADEYLRLSYHGFRAKDKNFNATINTDFDNSIEKANIIPQDIGRVLLNLFNNAFYTVAEKKKCQPDGYEPKVILSTKRLDKAIEICVRDNGNGIPLKIVDKIFQPFFTTKPTGAGTGLGLSLSYDIVKAHGGEIKVETKEEEGTEFIILLPINKNV